MINNTIRNIVLSNINIDNTINYQFAHSASRPGETEFLSQYNPKMYARDKKSDDYFETADNVLIGLNNNQAYVLVIKRRNYPFKNYYALPGGFIDKEDTDSITAAIRELQEETGIILNKEECYSVGSYDKPRRDPRYEKIRSYAIVSIHDNLPAAIAADDAIEVDYIPVNDILQKKIILAFDHSQMVYDAVSYLQDNIRQH